MYQYIIGDIEEINEDNIVIENNGIGYIIYTSKNSIMNIGQNTLNRKIYTHLVVREDVMSLYGFTSKEELEMFKLLITVTKIGPKVGIGILSAMNPSNIKISIMSGDTKALSRAPGVGKKTAERIILELKDKIGDNIMYDEGSNATVPIDETEEVIVALNSLGYTRNEIFKALSVIDIKDKKTEDIIKLALRKLSK
ncbi:Holliday junction DNA helicase subunit RuvA [Proteiniborus ethanoligenes]|uniref:Holliday junction branch migration complex subunit RuvA n=1 Tax=Proteiniborus ethanoligenes TaxID=415015 RepID=A0A1H3QR57_9FIRM|nr:Holliday junction branch migration protein RuvA [Proteiniborus ethanoligenes]TAH62995.1 MAG: Holliday junction branch migration protein RuvA [Gottschalkiaceae bacterium]SDZ15887.1 Holliday junction DNA helicase subunit RuvA [Proteiniborus ethanoligenes]